MNTQFHKTANEAFEKLDEQRDNVRRLLTDQIDNQATAISKLEDANLELRDDVYTLRAKVNKYRARYGEIE
jgi:mRNA-degrading endonuclease RelE of RelBE toxin-antitoxin system